MKEFKVRVVAGASRNKVVKTSNGALKIYVTTAPEKGKANKAVLKLLSEEFGVSKSSVSIVKGIRNKDKIVRIGV